jgi:DNA-binding NarL/FixJ family response regulator
MIDNHLLSDRETQVIAALAAGKKPKEIARELYISGCTVRTYIGRIRAKLGVSTTAEAIYRLTNDHKI